MSKFLSMACAVLLIGTTLPVAAQTQILDGVHFGSPRISGGPFGDARPNAGLLSAHYYGGIYRGAGSVSHSGLHRTGVWTARYGYYGDWRQSYWPYWGWNVAAGLLASAPNYYYGVGFGDELGYEAPVYDGAVACCMRRFRSYNNQK